MRTCGLVVAVVLLAVPAPAATFVVTTTADSADGACDAHCSLREAVTAANLTPGADSIVVPAGVFVLAVAGADEDAAATGDLDLTESCAISGAGAMQTVIDGAGGDRLFEVWGDGTAVTLTALTLRNGHSTEYGGAILVRSSSSLALEDCAFIRNASDSEGGAVQAWGPTSVERCVFTANAAGAYGGAIDTTAALEIGDSTFTANQATYGGGVIFLNSTSQLELVRSTLVGNEARYGGALDSDNAPANLTNVTMTANSDIESGGSAIHGSGGPVALHNCTLVDNGTRLDRGALYSYEGASFTIGGTIVAGGAYPGCTGNVTSLGHNLDAGTGCPFTAEGDLTATAPGLSPLTSHGGAVWTHALRTGSPAVDAVGTTFPATDARGVARPQGAAADIGAYEADGSEPPVGAPSTVPVIAHLSGVGGTPWRADVSFSNPVDVPLALTLRYTPAPGTVLTHGITLSGHQTLLMEDVVSTVFGAGDGRGGLEIVPPAAGSPPAVLSRTFAVQDGERLGQGMPALELLPSGTYFVTGLREDTAYRANVAVTAGATDVHATLTLFRGGDGAVGSSIESTIPAGSQVQWRVPDLFPGLARNAVPMTVRIVTDAPSLPYGSLVDQTSTDAATLIAQRAGSWWLVPVVAHNGGLDGTFWRSDVSLFNPFPVPVEVILELRPENTDNGGGGSVAAPVTIPAFGTVTLADITDALFGFDNAKGTLMVIASPQVVITSRTYTTRADSGTYGLGVPAVGAEAFSPRRRIVTGVRNGGGYRTNLGFAGPPASEPLGLVLRAEDGSQLAVAGVTVPARGLVQKSLDELFGAVAAGLELGSVEIQSSGQPVLVYVSVVDGSAQDPIYALVPPVPAGT